MRIVVLHNAVSENAPPCEREVLEQAFAIVGELRSLGHTAEVWSCSLNLDELRSRLLADRPHVVFNLVEMLGGSDRLLHLAPALLETLDIPYTGCSATALSLSTEKDVAKTILRTAGLPTPQWLGSLDNPTGAANLPYPASYIVKAVAEHSSFGLIDDSVRHCETAGELLLHLQTQADRLQRCVLAERFIAGREFNLALLDGPDGPQVLRPSEILFEDFPADKPQIVGYAAKWNEDTPEYLGTPRRFDMPAGDRSLLRKLNRLSLACWRLFRLRGYARVDFRVDEQGQPWILEVNGNPCLNPEAGFVTTLAASGLSYRDGIDRILQAALSRFTDKRPAADIDRVPAVVVQT